MKKAIVLALGLLVAHFGMAQTALPGKQEIDKTQFEGLYITSKIEEKYLANYWENFLKQYGKVSSSRGGVYRVAGATISNISTDAINLASKVSSSRGISQVFVYLDLGNGTYVTQGSKGYAETEAMLKKFAEDAQLYDDSRISEEALKDSEKATNKLVRNGEGLKKDIEKTTKKLEDYKKELEVNDKDLAASQAALETKKKAFDDAKAKLPAKN
jgi:hypothetical protein